MVPVLNACRRTPGMYTCCTVPLQVLAGMRISLEDMEDASKYYEEQGDTQVLTCSPSGRERPGTHAC